jgi:hypothetical protein
MLVFKAHLSMTITATRASSSTAPDMKRKREIRGQRDEETK